jgi:hypothetical protein
VRLSAPLLTLAGTVAGTAAAVVAYQATAAAPDARPASATTEDPAPQSTTSWLPCERGWTVEGNTCVRIKEKVVVVNDLPAQAAAPARTAGVRSTSHDSAGDDSQENEVEHADEDEVENESDDDSRDEADHQSEDTPDPEDVGHDD